MNKYFSLLSVTALAVLLCLGCSEASKGCSIEGQTDFQEYSLAYLVDMEHRCLDSVKIHDGKFSFQVTDTVQEPYGVMVELVNVDDTTDILRMPVMVEAGTVSLRLGDYVYTSGTPLNQRIQEFLNALQLFKDGLEQKKDIGVEQIAPAFSEFYRQQILQNAGTAVGSYIFHDYGMHLTPDDRDLVEAQLKH